MSPWKRFLHSDFLRGLFCSLVSVYLRFVFITIRWDHDHLTNLEPLYQKGDPFIVALWHNRIVMTPLFWPYKKRVTVLTSGHRDGQLVSQTIAKFGFDAIHGSSEQGGSQALRTIIRELRAGKIIAMAPDGPRGPRMRLKPGIITMARLSGVPIIPVCYSTQRKRFIKSWDRLLVPFPFGRGKVIWGEPVHVSKDIDRDGEERVRVDLETRMNEMAEETDDAIGSDTVDPAPSVDFQET